MDVINPRVIYLDNLRSDIGLKNLKDNIYNLFVHYLGIDIAPNDIFIHTNHGKDSWNAYVNCHEEHQAEYVLDQLKSWDSRRRTRFNYTSICAVSQSLASGYKTETVRKKKSRKKPKHKGGEDIDYQNSYQEENFFSAPLSNGFQNSKKSKDPVHGIYLEGEQLGNETRNKEFKKGGGEYIKNVMKKHVSKYVCAFLNSGEEGTLYIGVNDDGYVEGILCPQSLEDEVRLHIDEAIKAISPSVFTNIYTVKFTPVYFQVGVPKENHKVIEIIVHGTGDIDRLYHSPHGVFLRRDGGVQKLGVTEVQEWSVQKHQKKIQILEERLKRQEDMFEARISHEEKEKKSKVCVVM